MSVDFTQETDAGLMLLIGAAGPSSAEDKALAHKAFRELHSRHYGYLLGVLERFTKNAGTVVIDPKEFVQDTFKKAFHAAGTFRDMSDGDAVKSRAQMRGWLGVIAGNLARTELDRVSRLNNRIHFVPLDETRDTINPPVDDESSTPTEPKALSALQNLLRALKPAESDILLTYSQFGFQTENGWELHESDREALMQRTGYERSNIRQKWRRLNIRLLATLAP